MTLAIDPADLVDFAPTSLHKPCLGPTAPANAVHYVRSSRGDFVRRALAKLDTSSSVAGLLERYSAAVLSGAEVALTAIAAVWVYGVAVSDAGELEPGLSTSFRFFVIIACFRTLLKFSEAKSLRASLAPIFYFAAFIVAIAAAPSDDEVVLEGTGIVGNYEDLVLARAVLVWLGLGLELAGFKFSKVVAVDLNLQASAVYSSVFGENVITKDITALPIDWFEKQQASVWSMSPPCQPYTRQGERKDEQDTRAGALGHLTEILKNLRNLPKLIFLENVEGFQVSRSYLHLKQVLNDRGYKIVFQELVNPLDYGFPNSRLRFYLVASLVHTVPKSKLRSLCGDGCKFRSRPVSDFLDENDDHSDALLVPLATLQKPSSFAFDLVAPVSTQTMCFTGGYGRLINGSGSVLYTGQAEFWDERNRPILSLPPNRMAELHGKLRYFSASEIARLEGFSTGPICEVHGEHEDGNHQARFARLKFPDTRRGYKVLGNSLNPYIVAMIARSFRILRKSIQNPPLTPWLQWIATGRKTFEGRLFRDDWQFLQVNDVVEFEVSETRESVLVKITEIRKFPNFRLAHEALGDSLVPEIPANSSVDDLYRQFFSDEEVRQHGVVCLGVSVISSSS